MFKRLQFGSGSGFCIFRKRSTSFCYEPTDTSEITNSRMLKLKVICKISELIFAGEYHYYRPRMREGNVFILSVSVSVCLSVCLSVCVYLSVRAITFECLDIETSFLVWCYILTISRSSLSIKVTESRSRSLW